MSSLSRADAAGTALDALFRPASVAVIGASGRPGNPFAAPLKNLRRLGYSGRVYPVNPAYDELEGWRCYPSILDVPEAVDLALLMVPARAVSAAVEACGQRGVGFAIVTASGFAEAGADGAELQDEVYRIARASGVRLVGPNCQGVVSVPAGLAATFSPSVSGALPRAGSVAFVGQSGAVGGSVLDLGREAGLGISEWLTVGNQADIDLIEVAEYYLALAHVEVVAVYFEAILDGERFLALARHATELGKHVVVLRSGRSATGRRAAASHTGAMLGSDFGLELVGQSENVVAVRDIDALIRVAHALSTGPRPAGTHVGIVSTSGGAGALAADVLHEHDLQVPELPADVQKMLGHHIPSFGSTANPVDVTAALFSDTVDRAAFGEVCAQVLDCAEVDQLVIILTTVVGELAVEMARRVIAAVQASPKPVHLVWLAGHDHSGASRAMYREAGLPVYASISELVDTASAIRPRRRPGGVPAVLEPRAVRSSLPTGTVLEADAGPFLELLAVPRPRSTVAGSAEQAGTFAAEIGAPVVLKAQSATMAHKSEVGGVRVGVQPADAGAVWGELRSRFGADVRILVQELVPGGIELLVGVTAGMPGLPAVVTVGAGGVTAELYHDVVSRLVPLSEDEALEMIGALKIAPLLSGFRGAPERDVAAAARAISAIGAAAVALGPRLLELEINPLIVGERGAVAADFLAHIEG